jgi:probable phosphomutase (TIGR03848 family)
VSTVLLVRHGLTALTGTVLSGWTPGLHLDDRGRGQAATLGERLKGVPVSAIVSSPLERCFETATALAHGLGVDVQIDDRLGEVRYGDWTGGSLKTLARDPLWKVVQAHPSGVTFPGGEALRDMQARAVAAVRDWDVRMGQDGVWLACTHADPIRAIVADALGLHLDQFQRIGVDPCSLTIIRYTPLRPFVIRLNDTGGVGPDLVPRRRRDRRRGPAPGRGAGHGGVT